VRNYLNEFNEPDNSVTIWDDYWDVGEPNQHSQQFVINYDLPINKIPVLKVNDGASNKIAIDDNITVKGDLPQSFQFVIYWIETQTDVIGRVNDNASWL
jgi:hypothetical protein